MLFKHGTACGFVTRFVSIDSFSFCLKLDDDVACESHLHCLSRLRNRGRHNSFSYIIS